MVWEWPFWRAFRAGKVTHSDYHTITYPILAKINAILDMEDSYKIAEEGVRAEDARIAKLKEQALHGNS